MLTLSINVKRDIVDNMQRELDDLGEMGSRRMVSMTLNRVGHHAYVEAKRKLRDVTGIAYNAINQAVVEHKASPQSLVYRVVGTGHATNLREFRAYQGPRSFSAAPWATRRTFPRTFIVGGSGALAGIVMHRVGDTRDIAPSYGPNISVEMRKSEVSAVFFDAMKSGFMPELSRVVDLKLSRRAFTKDD